MPVPDTILDPADFVIVPNVFVIDEFDMTGDDGEVVARIDDRWIAKCIARMQEREAKTGDLCPFVIGHTRDNPQGNAEVNGPPLVGYFRNWKQLPFFDSGKTGGAPDAWIYKEDVERVKRFPRRSSEVWVTKYEIDPVSALGATTPARDLGMLNIPLKLARGAEHFTYDRLQTGCLFECRLPNPVQRFYRVERSDDTPPTNRESQEMPDEKKPDVRDDKPKADPAQSGANKGLEGLMQQVLAAIQSLSEKFTAGAGTQSPTAAAGAEGAGGGQGEELSDDELNQMLAQMGGGEGEGAEEGAKGKTAPEPDAEDDKSRKGEKPIQNAAVSALAEKLARRDEEFAVMRTKLARTEVKERLRKAVDEQGANIDLTDDKLVTELVAMPEDMRESMVVRLSRNVSKTAERGHASAAIQHSKNPGSGKRVQTTADRSQVMKLARQKSVSYEEAAKELGFTIGNDKDE